MKWKYSTRLSSRYLLFRASTTAAGQARWLAGVRDASAVAGRTEVAGTTRCRPVARHCDAMPAPPSPPSLELRLLPASLFSPHCATGDKSDKRFQQREACARLGWLKQYCCEAVVASSTAVVGGMWSMESSGGGGVTSLAAACSSINSSIRFSCPHGELHCRFLCRLCKTRAWPRVVQAVTQILLFAQYSTVLAVASFLSL